MANEFNARETLRLPFIQALAAGTDGSLLVAAKGGVGRLTRGAKQPTPLDEVSALQVFEQSSGLLVLPGRLEPDSSWRFQTDWPELRRDGKPVHRFVPAVEEKPGSQHRWVSQVLPDAEGRHVLVSWCWGFTGQARRVVSVFSLATGAHVRTAQWEPPDRADLGEGVAWSARGTVLVWHGAQLHEVPLTGAITSRPAPLVHERLSEGYRGHDILHRTEGLDGWHLLFAKPASQPRQLPAFLCDEHGQVITLEPCDAAGLTSSGQPWRVLAQQLELLARDGTVQQTVLRDTKTKVVATATVGGSWYAATAKTLERVELSPAGAEQRPGRAREAQPRARTADPRAALWAAPTDPALLAVCADWFIEQGAHTRGEYMQLSLQRSRTAAQDKRRAALLKFRGDWLGEARPFVSKWVDSATSPGFVAALKCSPRQLIDGAAHFRWLGPRLVVELAAVKNLAEARALASLELPGVFGFVLDEQSGTWLRQSMLAALAPLFRAAQVVVLQVRDSSRDAPADLFSPVLEQTRKASLVALSCSTREFLDGKVQPVAALRELESSTPGPRVIVDADEVDALAEALRTGATPELAPPRR